jgi:hypothetical protein
MRVQLTRGAVLASENVPPDWYPFEVVKIDHNESEKDKSEVDQFHLKVIDGEYKDKILMFFISEKFTSAETIRFYEVMTGIKINKDLKEFPLIDHDEFLGKRGMVKTKRGEYNGRPQDQVEDFRPLVKAVTV